MLRGRHEERARLGRGREIPSPLARFDALKCKSVLLVSRQHLPTRGYLSRDRRSSSVPLDAPGTLGQSSATALLRLSGTKMLPKCVKERSRKRNLALYCFHYPKHFGNPSVLSSRGAPMPPSFAAQGSCRHRGFLPPPPQTPLQDVSAPSQGVTGHSFSKSILPLCAGGLVGLHLCTAPCADPPLALLMTALF